MVYLITAFSTGKVRKECFSEEFMSQFNGEHQKAFGTDAPVGGLPDDGNGYYSKKLPYKDWYVFNNWVRAHLNFLETMMPNIVMIAIAMLS